MLTDLRHMTGEQLLLLSVLGGAKVQTAIDRELDHRAVLGRVRKYRHFGHPVPDPRWAA